jgi:hypothetical protein
VTRRGFLALTGGAFALGALAACGGSGGGGGGGDDGPVVIYALSGRGRRVSNAAKKHNANLRFRTILDAETNHAHPGDTSFVVPLTVSHDVFDLLFPRGASVADLRNPAIR